MSSTPNGSTGGAVANFSRMKECSLPELRIHSPFIDDALQAVLHTLLFVRAPSDMKSSSDKICESLAPLMYATCGSIGFETKVNATIELLKRSLVITGGGNNTLRGEIALSFYTTKENRGWLFSQIEHHYFERWRLPIIVMDFPRRRHTMGGIEEDSTLGSVAPPVDANTAYRQAYDAVTKAIMQILEVVNTSSTQLPASAYDFEFTVTDVSELRSVQPQPVSTSAAVNPGTPPLGPRKSTGGMLPPTTAATYAHAVSTAGATGGMPPGGGVPGSRRI